MNKKIIFTIVIILCSFLAVFVIREIIIMLAKESNTFQYNGLQFEKEKIGNITFYKTALFVRIDDSMVKRVFYFRNDPRKLEKIPVETEITKPTKKVYISYTPEALKCEDIMLVAWGLGSFFGNLDIDVKAGLTESENQSKIINCTSHKGKIIIVKAGSKKTRIYSSEENKDCVLIEAKNCEILEGAEKLMLEILFDTRQEKI